jgi:diphthine methyl ester synthase
MLYMIGIGLNDHKDISVKGLEMVRKSSKVFLEAYTSILQCSLKDLEEFYQKSIVVCDREFVEQKVEAMLELALVEDVAFLVIGDVFGATTHVDLYQRALKKGVKVEVVFNASVLSAVGVTGLELYKFGKVTSICFESGKTAYDVVKMNKANGLHTLCLLDIKVKEPTKEALLKGFKEYLEPKFMTVNEGLQKLVDSGLSLDTLCVGCARLGGENIVKTGTVSSLLNYDFGKPLHCLIVIGDLHFVEEEMLNETRLPL